MNVLQRFTWNGQAVDLRKTWCLTKDARRAVCRLFTHQFGWELHLEIDADLIRSAVCRVQEDVCATYESWKAAMQKVGWT